MDEMDQVLGDVLWDAGGWVNASRAAAASPKKTIFDFIWFFLFEIGSMREVGPHSLEPRWAGARREERIERLAPDIEAHAAAIIGKDNFGIVRDRRRGRARNGLSQRRRTRSRAFS